VLGKLERRTAAAATARVVESLARDAGAFRTITADNDTELQSYRDIEAAIGAKSSFATPQHSWERGTNENTNERQPALAQAHLHGGRHAARLRRDCRQAQLKAEEAPGLQDAGGMLCRSQVGESVRGAGIGLRT
jgi:hypothetical protein